VANKFIIRIERAEDWRAVGFFHLRPTEASGVGPGFELHFGDYDFTTASAILAAVDLEFFWGHGFSGDFRLLVGEWSLAVAVVTGKWPTIRFSLCRGIVNYVRNFLYTRQARE
jgi:hypothetical protein